MYFGGDSSSQRSNKIWRKNVWPVLFVVQKLQFEIKNWYIDTQTVPYQPGVPLGGGQLSVGVPKIFFSCFIPSLNLLKFSAYSLTDLPQILSVKKRTPGVRFCGIKGN